MKKVITYALLVTSLLLTGCTSSEKKEAIANYNAEVERINGEKESLEDAINKGNELLAKRETPLDESTITNLENAISDGQAIIQEIPKQPSKTDEINNLLNNTLKTISYTGSTEAIIASQITLENSIKQYQQVSNPSQEFIISRLKGIDTITDIAAVTEDNDPNGKLNKEGGYTAQVYFASSNVDQSQVSGDTLIDKGTSAGGSIEVYTTVDYANKRNDYLSNFDGTFIDSGSHKVIGTVIVRTSDELTARQQDELEAKIIEALTRLD